MNKSIKFRFKLAKMKNDENAFEKSVVNDYVDAIEKNNIEELTSLFKKYRVSLNQTIVLDNMHYSLLSLALSLNHDEMYDLLIALGADPYYVYTTGEDLAWSLVDLNKMDRFYAIFNGFRANLRLPDNKTRLMQAVEYSNVELVKMYLAMGLNPADRDKNGWTALHYNFHNYPYTQEDQTIALMLISVGLDPFEKDLKDVPAYGYLRDKNVDPRLKDILRKCPDLNPDQIKQVKIRRGEILKSKADEFLPKFPVQKIDPRARPKRIRP